MDNKNFAFTKTNFLLVVIGVLIVIIGFFLMAGGGSTETQYNPEIFSALRVKVAPVVCLLGFLFMIFAVIYHKKDKVADKTSEQK